MPPFPITALPDKESLPSFPIDPLYVLEDHRFPWGLLFSRLSNPKSLSLSLVTLIILVDLLWTCSNSSMSLCWRSQS